jgi:hypothetical protein
VNIANGVVIVSGLVIGYWLVSAFLPNRDGDVDAPPEPMDGIPPDDETPPK